MSADHTYVLLRERHPYDEMRQQEKKEYLKHLVEALVDQELDEMVLPTLEKYLSQSDCGLLRDVAIKCVQLRENMDQRLRKFRASVVKPIQPQ